MKNQQTITWPEKNVCAERSTARIQCPFKKNKLKASPLHFTENESVSDRMSAACAPELCTVTWKTLILNQHCALLQMTVYMHCKKHRLARTEKDGNTPHLLHGPLSYYYYNR